MVADFGAHTMYGQCEALIGQMKIPRLEGHVTLQEKMLVALVDKVPDLIHV